MTRRVNHRQIRIYFPGAASERHAVHAAGQIDVGEKNIHGRGSEVRKSVRCVGHSAHDKPLLRQVFGNHIADQEFILDKQQANWLSLIELSLVDVGAHYGIAPCVAWR